MATQEDSQGVMDTQQGSQGVMDTQQGSQGVMDTQQDTIPSLLPIKGTSYTYRPMPDPLSVYVPLESLTKNTIQSLVTTIHGDDMPDWDYSGVTLLAFLLAIDKRLKQIEQAHASEFDEQMRKHVENVRQWLVLEKESGQVEHINWDNISQLYENMKNTMEKHRRSSPNRALYYELTIATRCKGVEQSRVYMARSRSDGWKPHELKIYWNAEQLETLCQGSGQQGDNEKLPPHDSSDVDAMEELRKYPVAERNHSGKITYVNKGIEKAVFDIPDDAQIILLNFANECSPGGGYLRGAIAQEEIILYNSDGYRALLDLKYGRMGGGYAIPEFGLAYVRDICLVDKKTERTRLADMLVSACYCLLCPQLYPNPKTSEQRIENDAAKFQAFISAAVANTKGNGSNTYLLLGPIGTGAFGNDVEEIAHVFRRVLNSKMMGSTGPISKAFEHIWFVSIDDWKNKIFEDILSSDKQ